jgi:hypothetical protein
MEKKTISLILLISIVYWLVILSIVWYTFQNEYGGVLSKTVWTDPYHIIGYRYVAGQNFVFFSVIRAISLYVIGFGVYLFWKAKNGIGKEINIWEKYLSKLKELLVVTVIFSAAGSYIFLFLFSSLDIDGLTSLSIIIVLYFCTIFVYNYISKRKKLKVENN